MAIKINKRRFVPVVTSALIIIILILSYKPFLRTFVYPQKYSEYVTSAAASYGLDPLLIYSVIKAESGFDKDAQSPKGAKGLMQIMDTTAEWIYTQTEIDHYKGILVPKTNINTGSWYLSKLLSDENGNLIAALASYNAGGTNVAKWKNSAGTDYIDTSDIEFAETENYVNKILKYYKDYKKLYREE